MDDATFEGVVWKLANDAAFHIDNEIADDRMKATAYYRGDPLGDEEEGRSQVVMSTVRDTVNAVLPSLLRIFAGSETAVEFVPSNEGEVQMATDATDAINDIFYTKNHGYSQVLEPSFQDALVRKSGIVYWWYEERTKVREFLYKGLTEDEMDLILAQDDNLEITSKLPVDSDHDGDRDPTTPEADPLDPTTDPAIAGAIVDAIEQSIPGAEVVAIEPVEQRFDFRVRRKTCDPLIRVESLAPEQFIISRTATHEGNALCIGRRQTVTVSDLVSLGFDFDEIVENAGSAPTYSVSATNVEAAVRNPALLWARENLSGDDSLREVLYNELYCRIDRDGDGIAELWRVQTLGDHHYILHSEIYEDDEPPFAILCPFPEPHRAIGYSLADRLMDLQAINTRVWRNTLDSFSASIHPRTVVIEGQVNLDDVLNTEIGAIIRARQPGAVQEFVHSFQGQNAMALLGELGQIKAERTGVSAASQGLDAEVLQSTTASAVAATTSAADQTTEMIARRFAEGGLKRMFAGMLRLLCRHFDQPLDITRRDGSMGQIDPRTINPDLLLTCNVGLGKGKDQDRLQMLSQVLQYQQMILSSIGPSPIVGPAEVRNTLASMLQIAGIKDVSKYFKPIPPGWQPNTGGQAPNPQMVVAQGQVQSQQIKNEIDALNVRLEHEREMQKMANDFAVEKEKLAQQRILTLAQLEAQYGSQMQQAEMDAQIAREKAQIDFASAMASQQVDLGHAADQAHQDRLATLHGQALQHSADHAESTYTPAPAPLAGDTGAPTL